MLPSDKRLLDLTAGDLMSRDLIAFPTPMTVLAAAYRLCQTGVSGGPVVDEQGNCVGVLSTSDLVRFLDRGPLASRRSNPVCRSDYFSDAQVELEALPVDDVGRYMTTDVVTASEAMPIGELARCMLDAHIHRIIVTDSRRRPVGIVTSMDVLAAVAAEQLRQEVGATVHSLVSPSL